MLIRTSEFSFDIPDEWTTSTDRDRLVCIGRHGEEFIISVTKIQSKGGHLSSTEWIKALYENALEAGRTATTHPDLEPIGPAECFEMNGLEFTVTRVKTLDETTLFCVAVVKGSSSVLLGTFEAPNSKNSTAFFNGLLQTIQREKGNSTERSSKNVTPL